MNRKGFLRLGLFAYPAGHHIAAWRHPDSSPGAGINFDYYRDLARHAEAAKFDLIFLADGAGQRSDNAEILSRTAHSYVAQFEPVTLLSALAVSTRSIGLVATISSSFNEPYHIARKFASIDHLSGGRAGLNLVTSASDWEARNFGLPAHLDHADRYARAGEFADVLNHSGAHFTVRGPLNVPRPPQGRPVLVQAGSSPAGRDLAARTAEVVFTAQQTTAEAAAFATDLRGRAAGFGRDPDHIRVMPGIFPVVAPTRAEAQAKFDQLQGLIHPAIGLDLIAGGWVGIDLSHHDLDGPLPELPPGNGSPKKCLITESY